MVCSVRCGEATRREASALLHTALVLLRWCGKARPRRV